MSFHARQELTFGFRDTELIKRILDFLRNVVPSAALVVSRLEVVIDVLEIDTDMATPVWHRLGVKDLKRFETEIQHPGWLVLHFGDLANDVAVDAFSSLEDGGAFSAKVVFVNFADGIGRFEREVG